MPYIVHEGWGETGSSGRVLAWQYIPDLSCFTAVDPDDDDDSDADSDPDGTDPFADGIDAGDPLG